VDLLKSDYEGERWIY